MTCGNSREAIIVIHTREHVGLDQSDSSRGGGKCQTEPEYILKVEAKGFLHRLNEDRREREESQMILRYLGQSNWKNEGAIN